MDVLQFYEFYNIYAWDYSWSDFGVSVNRPKPVLLIATSECHRQFTPRGNLRSQNVILLTFSCGKNLLNSSITHPNQQFVTSHYRMRGKILPTQKNPSYLGMAGPIPKLLYVLKSLVQCGSFHGHHVKLYQDLHLQHGEKRDHHGHPLRGFDHQGHPGQVEHV